MSIAFLAAERGTPMSNLAKKRRALRLYRWRSRQQHLTIPRGDYPGWPSDVLEVAGHHPEFPRLQGWIFSAWQYQPWKPNPPWWWLGSYPPAYGVTPGDWVLRRAGIGGVFAVLPPPEFDRWRSYKRGDLDAAR